MSVVDEELASYSYPPFWQPSQPAAAAAAAAAAEAEAEADAATEIQLLSAYSN